MKTNSNFFYGSGQGVVRVSNRIYQPIDIKSVLDKQILSDNWLDAWKVEFKIGTFALGGFLFGWMIGQLVINNYLPQSEFSFLMVASGFFQSISLTTLLSSILSAGLVGMVLGIMLWVLSLLPVLD